MRRCISRCSARSIQNTGKRIGARCHQTPNIFQCVYLTPTVSALVAISAVRARICTKRRDPSRRAGGEDGRKRERKTDREIEQERSKHLDYVYVHAKHLLRPSRERSSEREGNTYIMYMYTLNTCYKRIIRHKRSARTLCAATDFSRLSVYRKNP